MYFRPPGVKTLEKNLKTNIHTKRRNGCNEELNHSKKQFNCKIGNSAQENMVKVEPESDCDIPKKKKKNKHSEVNGDENDLSQQDSSCYDESFLELKVKQEEKAALLSDNKIKKKRNLSESVDDNQSVVKKSKLIKASLDSYTENPNGQLHTDIKTKKKKKKSKKRKENKEEVQNSCYKDSDDAVSEEEVDSHGNTQTNPMEETSVTVNTFENESCEISAIQSDEHNIHTLSFNSSGIVESKNKSDSLYKTAIINQFKSDINEGYTTLSRRPRLSDRITFEDDSDTELNHTYNNATVAASIKLTKFIKTIDNMKLISQEISPGSNLTCDDEVWIVHCPKDIDVASFCDTEINVNGKGKVKVGGQTYDTTLDSDGCGTTAGLMMAGGKYQINNLPQSGIIKFRKRIPKAHFRDDNIMVNNQTNFIPLPETKCRHPLFGANYKKALKIPSAVAQQLNSLNEPEEIFTLEKRKKKKHRRDKDIVKDEETDSKCEVSTIPTCEPVENGDKKRKKRKRLEEEGPAPKKIKKIKHDPESAEAWESERAIEQNLFNF